MKPPVEVGYDEARALLGARSVVLVDVRDPEEIATGHIPDAAFLSMEQTRKLAPPLPPLLSRGPVLFYCALGNRSAEAAAVLNDLGGEAVSLVGGIAAWRRYGGEIVGIAAPERYARQLRLSEVGVAGQKKIMQARVLVLGAGGLGSPALMYLAAAGVGVVGVMDADVVEETNLHRQVVHTSGSVGVNKAASAASTLRALNPTIKVRVYEENYDLGNMDVIRDYDVVVDGVDNLRTRYILNEACVRHGKPMVYASILSFSGQISVFNYEGGPCYRCVFPQPPPPELVPSCSAAGVLGPVVGVIGCMQAVEALKIIVGTGGVMADKLLVYDALAQDFDKLRTHKDSACPTCSRPEETDLKDLLGVIAAC